MPIVATPPVDPSQLRAGDLAVPVRMVFGHMRSRQFQRGVSGWEINYAGDAEFNNVTVRGTIISGSGEIAGFTIEDEYIEKNSVRLSSAGYLGIGGTIPTSYGDEGIWLGMDGATPKFSIYKDANNSLLYDGTNIALTGSITASSGSIAGWNILANAISQNNAVLHSSGYLSLGSGNNIARLDAVDANFRLWIGNAVAASAPFRVSPAGVLTASNATISGTINASAGTFTGTLNVNGTLRSSSSGKRWILEATPRLRFFDSVRERMRLTTNRIQFWDSSGGNAGYIEGFVSSHYGGPAIGVFGNLEGSYGEFIGVTASDVTAGAVTAGQYQFGSSRVLHGGSSYVQINEDTAYDNVQARIAGSGRFRVITGSFVPFYVDINGDSVIAGNVISDQFTPSLNNVYRLGVVGGGWFEVNAYAYVTLSDKRLKKDFVPFEKRIGMSALDMVKAIPVTTYKYSDHRGEGNDNVFVGWIAQDVEKVAPNLVHVPQEDNPKRYERLARREHSITAPLSDHEKQELEGLRANYKALNDRDMVATLWQAVQELSEEVQELKKYNA